MLSGLFTKREFLTVLLRGGGVAVSAAAGVISIKAFLSFDAGTAAALVSISGSMVFVTVFQLGFGRPSYAAVRSRLAAGALSGDLVASFAKLALVQTLLATAVMSAIAAAIAHQAQGKTSYELAVFALGLASASSGVLQRDLAYALSTESAHESLETSRRLAMLLGYMSILEGASPALVGLLLLVAGGAAHGVMTDFMMKSAPPRSAGSAAIWRELHPAITTDAARYFFFGLCETLIYNLPLVVFSILGDGAGVIFFGIWMRLFQLLALPMRIVVDSRVNRIATAYFQGDFLSAEYDLRRSFLLGAGLCVGAVLVLSPLTTSLLEWIGADRLAGESWLIPATMIWCAGNAVQHVFGSFAVSNGKGFAFALEVSVGSIALMSIAMLVALAIGLAPGAIQVVLGVIYALSSLLYAAYAKRQGVL